MAQHSIRFPDELEFELCEQAEAEGRSFSQVVIRRCRRSSVARTAPVGTAPSEAEPAHDEIMRERQARLNRGYPR